MLNHASRKVGRATFKPTLEGLESRTVLSTTRLGSTLFITQDGDLNNSAVVTQEASPFGPVIKVQEVLLGGVTFTERFLASNVSRIVYTGGNGNDVFDNQTSLPCSAFGGAGNDKLSGGHSADVLSGGSGNDQLHGREGADLMFGGSGNDLMRGGQGNDRMFGNSGKDDMFGALGNDFLDGGRDGTSDILRGGDGADTFASDTIRIIIFKINRDKPQDFSLAQGDRVI